jgi:hypothetical protein
MICLHLMLSLIYRLSPRKNRKEARRNMPEVEKAALYQTIQQYIESNINKCRGMSPAS